jgi:hypothetical protein
MNKLYTLHYYITKDTKTTRKKKKVIYYAGYTRSEKIKSTHIAKKKEDFLHDKRELTTSGSLIGVCADSENDTLDGLTLTLTTLVLEI